MVRSPRRCAASVGLLGLLLVARVAAQDSSGTDSTSPDFRFRRAGPVLRWNVIARELITRDLRSSGDTPARVTFYTGNNNSRLYALVSGAQYDALRAERGNPATDAASAGAAAAVLRAVFPAAHGALASELAEERTRLSRNGIGASAITAAERRGGRAAEPWVRFAAAELGAKDWSGSVPVGPGLWPADGEPPALASSISLPPWFLTSTGQFRPPPPPAFDTPAFLAALAEVRQVTRERTRDQTKVTWRWARNAATLWSEVGGDLILRHRLAEPEAARVLMYLNMTLSDATIACWDAKLTYWLLRPSQADSTIDPSVPVPHFPSYPSAHATLFAAAAAVLGYLVPSETASLDSIAGEATMSRLWAGVHYRFDNEAGTRLGRAVAGLAIAAAARATVSCPRCPLWFVQRKTAYRAVESSHGAVDTYP
jgi:membrane-associated phospholipid phosphatase